MWILINENLTQVGGRMGSDKTWDNWRKYFYHLSNAMAFAERDYVGVSDITWVQTQTGYRSQDLGHVIYRLERIHVEDDFIQ